MKKMKILAVTLILVLGAVQSFSQKKKAVQQPSSQTVQIPYSRIIGKGKPYKDRIALRWNINDFRLFNPMVTTGVFIDRLIIGANDKAEENWKRVSPDTIKAKTMKQFNTPDFKTDTAAMVIAQTLYGKYNYPKDVSLIDQINMQEMDRQNRHMIVSLYGAMTKEGAFMAGLGFEDLIKPDSAKKYVYRVYPAKKINDFGKIDTGYIYVIGRDIKANEYFRGLKTDSYDSYITLKWPVETSPFSGYYIERSADKKQFERITKKIYIPQKDSTTTGAYYVYSDSIPNNKKFYYRLTGVNAFGEHHLYVDTVEAMARDLTPPHPPVMQFARKGNDITFTWTKPTEKDLKGYMIVQGKGLAAGDSVLQKAFMPPTTQRFEYSLPGDFKAAYYRLLTSDHDGNLSYSNPVYIFNTDSIPPAPPQGLTGSIDTLGIVHLKWNTDPDEPILRGYKVFFANQKDHAFTSTSNIVTDTVYQFPTTLKTLSSELYIRIAAVDANFNHSKFSEILKLKRPDTLAPVSPVILKYDNLATGVRLSWSEDKSTGFSHFKLSRKSIKDNLWVPLTSSKLVTFLDTTASRGTRYEYNVIAVDSAGNQSPPSFPLTLVTSKGNTNEEINLTTHYNAGNKQTVISWKKSARVVKNYLLYKDLGKGLTLYKRLEGNLQTYSD
ncbi:MAG: fibronectin type III domain-containing protein, partial [Pedobacter sp.]